MPPLRKTDCFSTAIPDLEDSLLRSLWREHLLDEIGDPLWYFLYHLRNPHGLQPLISCIFMRSTSMHEACPVDSVEYTE